MTNLKRYLSWGVIGTGRIAEQFARDLPLVPNARLAGVVSRRVDRAQNFADTFGLDEAAAFDDPARMIADPQVEAIYIATPNDTHRSLAELALSASKPVLIEKPLATSAADAEVLRRLATDNGTFIAEAMWTRFLPAIRQLQTTIEEGRLGQMQRIDAELAFHQPYDKTSRFYSAGQGGGAMLDLGVYPLSLCLALAGKPENVSGRWWAAPSGVDEAAEFTLDYPDIQAKLRCGFDSDGVNQFIVKGTEATAILAPPFNGARMLMVARQSGLAWLATLPGKRSLAACAIRKLVRDTVLPPGLQRMRYDSDGYGLHYQIEAVSEAVLAGRKSCPISPIEDSIEVLQIIEQVRAQPPEPVPLKTTR